VFLFKKIVSSFLFPVPLCLEIMLAGLFFLWFTRRTYGGFTRGQKLGRILVTLGVGLFAVLSYGSFPDMLLKPLEYSYPPKPGIEEIRRAKWIVVLGGGHVSDPRVPITSQLSEDSMTRLVEGIRLQKMNPEAKLLLSGGRVFDPVPNAEIMARVALSIGVDRQNMVLETASRDTKDEARIIKEMVGNDPFLLVTSASHMPRSMALFKSLGMNPVPAPTGHIVKETQGAGPRRFFPSVGGLSKAEAAFYEYLGLAWAKVRGQI
jgi:uncharacterized SAM-binding protein YcdF (DUF218 family)